MPKEKGPEWEFFGGEDGLITELTAGNVRHFWACQFCGLRLGGKVFPNRRAHIHLSGDPALRNGIVARVCDAAPADVKARFSLLVLTKRRQKDEETQKRKRAGALLKMNGAGASPFKQSKLRYRNSLPDDDVDLAWGRAFFGLDIPVAKISMPLFREAIVATQQSSRAYVQFIITLLVQST